MDVYTTARAALPFRHATATPEPFVGQALETECSVFVDPGKRDQTVLGIGAAITDAAAETFSKLPPARQEELLRACFDPELGQGYSLLRTTVHSCDFSPASYTYVDEGDVSLASFDIAHDRAHRLPMIRRALHAARGTVTVFASPWSAPAWMKDNGNMLDGGRLRPAMAAAWARYLAAFVRAYEAEGVRVWGLTVQNEPMARQRWESMLFTAEEERDFVKHHLGPTLQAEGLGDRRLIVWDHNRDLLPHRAQVILSDPEAARHVWGLGFHWYETWTGGEPLHRNVAAVHAAWPKLHLLHTEAAVERFDPAQLHSWAHAERYARQMIEDFNAGAEGWTDWNLLLDERGGPNHVGNFCFAPVHADTRSGELTYTPSFHAIGHFSRFVRPGARRVMAVASRSLLHTTAFEGPDGRLAVIVLNASDADVAYRLQLPGQQVALSLPARAIQTLLA